ncbi:hypothetical protein Vi05172_g2220 [Venturia inaequalis]|nr:hypothetical protein Vi05172_g2220 [Venturia inaequalis]
MKIRTILLLVGTATALVPHVKDTSEAPEAGKSIFARQNCQKWGGCCEPSCYHTCCTGLHCKFEEIPNSNGIYQGICRIHK